MTSSHRAVPPRHPDRGQAPHADLARRSGLLRRSVRSRPGRRPTAVTVLAAFLAATVAATLGAVLAGAGSPVAAQAATSGEACARVEVLLLMDQSASLQNTDPDDLRVQAAQELVRSLSLSAAAGGPPVNVTVAGFGTGVEEVGRATLPGDQDAALGLVQGFSEREGDLNTDYVLALQSAVNHFQAITDLPTDCKRMVWFTDGAYSIDEPDAPGIAFYTTSTDPAAIVAEFGDQTCGPLPGSSRLSAPLSQQIRQTGFVVQLVDLRNDEAETPAEREDRLATAPVIDRLLSGDANDPCAVPGGRVQANQANELAAEFFSQGQIALGRRPVSCDAMAAGWEPSLVRAVTVRGASPDQPLRVVAGEQALAEASGFVTWVRMAGAPSSGPPIRAGSSDGSTPAACFVDLAATIPPVGSRRIEPAADSTTLQWAVVGVGAEDRVDDVARRLGPDTVTVAATMDGEEVPVSFDDETRTWQVAVPGPVEEPPVVALTAEVDGYGSLASTSTALEAGALLAPPTVAWTGSTRFEGEGSFGASITVTPAEVPAGSPIPDGVVCLELGPPVVDLDGVAVQVADERNCHPAGESFAVPVEVAVQVDRNTSFGAAVPYTVVHQPVGGTEYVVAEGDVDTPTLQLAKPADALKGAVIGFVVIVLSTLLPLGLLLLLVNEQRRLPTPSSMLVARVPLRPDGGAVRRIEGATVASVGMTGVKGDRRNYELPSGLELVSPRTLNPFAPTVVEARSLTGRVTAVPWMAPGAGRSVQVPAGFTYLVLIRSEPGSAEAEAVVVGPAKGGTAAADQAVDDAVRATNRLWGRVSSAMRLIDL